MSRPFLCLISGRREFDAPTSSFPSSRRRPESSSRRWFPSSTFTGANLTVAFTNPIHHRQRPHRRGASNATARHPLDTTPAAVSAAIAPGRPTVHQASVLVSASQAVKEDIVNRTLAGNR